MERSEPIFQEYYRLPGAECGAIWRFSSAHRKPLHFHGHLELLLIVRGHAIERIGNALHRVHAGQLIWHLPGIAHELLFASNDLDLRVLHIEPDLTSAVSRERRARTSAARTIADVSQGEANRTSFSDWVRDLGWIAAGHPVVELRRADVDRLLDDCEAPFDDAPPRGDTRQGLSRLLHNAWEASVVNCDRTRASSIVELASCLLLEDPFLDRPSLCRQLDVSEGYLSRCFQKDLSTSFVGQRARMRLSRFVTHVARDRQNLLEAALTAGFGGYTQMHRTFSNLVGMSPSAYLQHGGRQRRAVLTR